MNSQTESFLMVSRAYLFAPELQVCNGETRDFVARVYPSAPRKARRARARNAVATPRSGPSDAGEDRPAPS
jgi:hypothetical protein